MSFILLFILLMVVFIITYTIGTEIEYRRWRKREEEDAQGYKRSR